MNVSSINALQAQEVTQTSGLRKAAANVGPPALTEDESQMIRREFSNTRPITFYKNDGRTQQQIVSGRGQFLDTKI